MEQPLVSGARRLARFIKRHKLTQAAVAAAIEVKPPAVHDYLTGRRRPEPEIRRRIEDATGGFVAVASWLRPGESPRPARSLLPPPKPVAETP